MIMINNQTPESISILAGGDIIEMRPITDVSGRRLGTLYLLFLYVFLQKGYFVILLQNLHGV